MRKAYLTVITIVLIAILAFGAWWVFARSASSPGSETEADNGRTSRDEADPDSEPLFVPLDDISYSDLRHPMDESFVIQTEQGGVRVNNFYLLSPTLTEGGTVVVTSTDAFWISYSRPTGDFWIAIDTDEAEFEEERAKAEAMFVDILGLSREDACRLEVWVGSPYIASSSFSASAFLLSFCEEEVQ